MMNLFISLRPNPPNGFEYRTPAKREILGHHVAVLADSLEDVFSLLNDFSQRACGIVITVGASFSHAPVGPALWHLVVPEIMLPHLYTATACLLDIMSEQRAGLDENKRLKIELAHSREIQKQTRDSFNENVERLGNKIEVLRTEIEGRKRAEEEQGKLAAQLRHSEKMDAIGQLAGGVAHDFNNLLGGVMGAAELLRIPERNLDETSLEFVDMIMTASRRAADLTAKLLAFGRKGNISTSVVDVHRAIDDAFAILTRTIDRKISIVLEKKAEQHKVLGDSSGLQNVFLNIAINASHSMPDGGEIQIRTRNIQLNKTYCDISPFNLEPGEYIEIEMRDTGCGIPFENISKIFEPFYTTKEQGKGTGLGLAAVYGMIQEHQGAITVYSEIEQGTSFHIMLRCAEGKARSVQAEVKTITGSGLILLVDDEEIIRITGKFMLQEMGYQVLLAKNGVEAVALFTDKYAEIDLVVMDMIMPRMNGREAFAEMRKIDNNCKIVISSGFTKNENLSELNNTGLAGFIQKPYRDYELSQLLAKILQ